MPIIYYDSVNYSIAGTEAEIYCYSYRKPIALWNVDSDEIQVFTEKITTHTNKKHLTLFTEWVENEKKK